MLANALDMTDEEFDKFAKLIYDETGIYMKDGKIILLSNRLKKRIRALQLKGYTEYYNYLLELKGDERDAEFDLFLDVVSTHETSFFRHESSFAALSNICFQEIVGTKLMKRLRIWSAACSTGEEPYSIAMCLLERMQLFKGWSIEILATDISVPVLEAAKKGRYLKRHIDKVPDYYLNTYFSKDQEDPEGYIIRDEVKQFVKFSRLNFFADPFPQNIDIIFCRNVMIYFDKTYQERLIKKFSEIINKPGFLFLGHAETLNGISDDFKYCKLGDSPVYIPDR